MRLVAVVGGQDGGHQGFGVAAGRRLSLRDALQQAGVNSFFLQKTERQLKLLGRHRGAQVYRWLLQADLDLKGDSAMPPRIIIERLIVRLAAHG